MSGLHKLGSIMEGFLKSSGTRNKIKSYMVLDFWPKVIGTALEGKTEARVVKNGVLYVTCVSPPLAHQLSFMKREILRKIAFQVGSGIIKDIRFQAGEVNDVRFGRENSGKGRTPQQLQELDAQEIALLDELHLAKNDPELQTAFLKAAITAKRVRKTRLQEGWRPCQKCGVLYDPDSSTSLCPVCEQKDSQKRVEAVSELLRLFPWKSYAELLQENQGLTQLEYQLARRDKLQQLGREINRITNAITCGRYLAKQAAGQAAQATSQAENELSKLRTLVLEYIMIYDAQIYQDLTYEKVIAVLGKNTAECLFS